MRFGIRYHGQGKNEHHAGKKMGGPPESSIIGLGDKVSNVSASFVNGELIMLLPIDITQDVLPLPGPGVYPA